MIDLRNTSLLCIKGSRLIMPLDTNIVDNRRILKKADKINVVNYNIINFDNFNSNMINKGYSMFTHDFLVKSINDVTINIARNNELVSAITAYDENQNVINIPEDILTEVTNDIEECNV